jgi:hypothetical protein
MENSHLLTFWIFLQKKVFFIWPPHATKLQNNRLVSALIENNIPDKKKSRTPWNVNS